MSFEKDLNLLKIEWKKKGYYESDYTYNFLDFSIIIFLIKFSTIIKNGFISGTFLGTAIHQFARLGHELGHQSGIFNVRRIRSQKKYHYCLLLINMCLGFDGFLWKKQHTQHHEFTMHNSDCQISRDYPVFSHHEDYVKKKIKYGSYLERKLFYNQHNIGLLFVVLFGKILLTKKYLSEIKDHDVILRKGFLLLHYLFIFLLSLKRYNKLGLYNSIQNIFMVNFICGILHIQLLFNHITTEHHNNQKKNDIKQQITNSVNYTCKPYGFWHWFHVSLGHQIEHHIDPKIASQHHHKMLNDVKNLCKKHDIEYKSDDFLAMVFKYRKLLRNVVKKSYI